MDLVIVKLDKDIVNLKDLYKQYNEDITFKIEYVLTGIDADFSFVADAELKEVQQEHSSLCVGDFENGAFGFDLFFELDNSMVNYEQYLIKTFSGNLNETLVDEIEDALHLEKAQKHLRTFYALLNPTFFLNLINEQENLKTLMEDGAINLDFDVFVLQITIHP